jgi:hypothetical protein
MDGSIRLFRCILESQVFAHQTALKIWIWCLCKATFKQRFVPLKIGRGEITVNLLPGQFIFGRFKAEEELGIDGSTIYKWIQKFASEEYEMINIECNNQYSIITISKWDEYQIQEKKKVTTKEQPSNNQVTAEGQPSNTNNKDNKDNKVKKENNYIEFEVFWNLYAKKEDRLKCIGKWNRLSYKEQISCIEKLPAYIKSTPNIQYRKNPATYLNNKSWENEIILPSNNLVPGFVISAEDKQLLKNSLYGK